MKLWLISQTVNNDWDTYDSAVVCAPDEITARRIQPGSVHFDEVEMVDFDLTKTKPYSSWAVPKDVVAVCIGDAEPGTKVSVICASFNAG